MRSQLARHVLRRLRAHQGMLHLCPTARPSLRTYPIALRVIQPQQTRTFFGFFQKAPRVLKEPEVEPGFESLLKFGAMKNDNLRPPPREELVQAFRDFFRHKKFNSRPVNAMQSRVALNVLKHLCDPAEANSDFALEIRDLRTAQDALITPPRDDPSGLLELSRALFAEIRKLSSRRGSGDRTSTRALRTGEKEIEAHALDTATMLRVLTQHGRSIEARDHLLQAWPEFLHSPALGYGRKKALWIPVLRGLAREDKEKELLEFLAVLEESSGLPFGRSLHEIMTTFYARRDEVEKMKQWFYRPIQPDAPKGNDNQSEPNAIETDGFSPSPSQATYTEVFRCAIRNDDRDWAISIYQDIANNLDQLSQRHYAAEAVLLIFRFAILLLGKGPEHIEHMMLANGDSRFQPSMDIMNAVIEAAIEKNDSYTAERLTALVTKLGLEPDRRLYKLQIEYRMRAGDLDGAFAAYRSFQNFENEREDWPLMNKLIRSLCALPVPSHDKVLDVTSFLEQQSATLEPETVVSLCIAFLKNDEQYEVIDTLSLHSVHFSWEERTLVAKAFVEFCLDTANSTARVWDAYALLRQFFPDMDLDDRVNIMDAFFDRKRADMASHVFGHMRQHGNPSYRPTLDIYVRCFEGLGRCPDSESLKLVHNMLKMDTTIQPTTRLYNALMIAYTGCDEYYRALDFWRDISNSSEGPSYQTLEIVFRTYQATPFGDEPAKTLWGKLQTMGIDIPASVISAYAGVLAAHAHLEETKALLGDMEAEVGQRPDSLTLAVVYNALPDDEYKDNFEAWAKVEFPHVWNKLEKQRRRRDAEGLRTFQISRPWKA
ncbi:hypothetical protein BX600DRAFT_509976 [Xylariales sp. PMI_506]|nr:hypothetical protein BX600DRAFT_509976 [Xylariales sp. PMI_506]